MARAKKNLRPSQLNAFDLASAAGEVVVVLGPTPLPLKLAAIAGLTNFVQRLF